MTVAELIEELEQHDENAEVILVTQENWPFENALRGVTCRNAIHPDDEEGNGGGDFDGMDNAGPNDVILVEGGQLRYTTKAWWGMI